MKQAKRPTRAQKQLMAARKLNPEDWLVVKDTSTEITLIHRHISTTVRKIPKEGR